MINSKELTKFGAEVLSVLEVEVKQCLPAALKHIEEELKWSVRHNPAAKDTNIDVAQLLSLPEVLSSTTLRDDYGFTVFLDRVCTEIRNAGYTYSFTDNKRYIRIMWR